MPLTRSVAYAPPRYEATSSYSSTSSGAYEMPSSGTLVTRGPVEIDITYGSSSRHHHSSHHRHSQSSTHHHSRPSGAVTQTHSSCALISFFSMRFRG